MLTLMRVIRTRVNLQLLTHMSSKCILGKHTPDGQFNHPIRMSIDHAPERDVLFAAHVTRMPEISLLIGLVAGQRDLLGIDHHDVITHIEMGGKHRLVFATNNACHFSGEAPESFPLGVDHPPSALDFVSFRSVCLHVFPHIVERQSYQG